MLTGSNLPSPADYRIKKRQSPLWRLSLFDYKLLNRLRLAENKVIHHRYIYIPCPIIGSDHTGAKLNAHSCDHRFIERNANKR